MNGRPALVLALLALWMSGVLAQTLDDPMRPPPRAQAKPTAQAATKEATPATLKATWIVGKRRFAQIDDEVVEQGGKFGDQRVVRVTSEEVHLDGPQGERTLALPFEIERTTRKRATPVGAATRTEKKSRRTSK